MESWDGQAFESQNLRETGVLFTVGEKQGCHIGMRRPAVVMDLGCCCDLGEV